MDNINNWDNKYKDKPIILSKPDSFIVDNVDNLSKGSALDLASGDGRNSIFLSKLGFDVTAVDFSIEALKRLDLFSNRENVYVKTALTDISNEHKLASLGKFDNIIISHYKLEDSLIPTVEKMLNKNGTLIYHTFNMFHHNKTGFNKSFCLTPNELIDKFSIKLIKYETITTTLADYDGYIFKSV